ncbi:MAG: hypothetical protein II767_07750 [Proteobacteria bacterium]|nr:hypothetical protein [Pseudomonadota bacterium]MBQ4360134.1 hypothetical protein [Pseudomonadota bacterium]
MEVHNGDLCQSRRSVVENGVMDKYQGDLLLVAVNYDEKTNAHACDIKRFVK